MASDLEIALPKMLRCHHIFCFCCFTKWFLGCKQNCPVCFASVAIKDIKTVQFERIEVATGGELDFVLVQKNLKNGQQVLIGNENNSVFFQKVFPLSFAKYEKMILKDIEELHAVVVTDPMITEFCQFVSMQFISNPTLIQTPTTLGKRKLATENKTFKEDFVDFYQQARGFNVFIHPVSFDFLLDLYGGYANLPSTVTLRIASSQKVTKSNFNRHFWSVFSHLGKNSDFLLVHVDFTDIYPEFDPVLYRGDLRSFEAANTAVPVRRPPRIRRKSFDSNSMEDDEPFCVQIHIKKKVSHNKINRYNEKKAARLEANLALPKGGELFEMAAQTASTETGSPNIVPAELSENGLIFPKLEEDESANLLFKKMEEKEKERAEKHPPAPKKTSFEALPVREPEPVPEFVVVTKKKKNQRERKQSRAEEALRNRD